MPSKKRLAALSSALGSFRALFADADLKCAICGKPATSVGTGGPKTARCDKCDPIGISREDWDKGPGKKMADADTDSKISAIQKRYRDEGRIADLDKDEEYNRLLEQMGKSEEGEVGQRIRQGAKGGRFGTSKLQPLLDGIQGIREAMQARKGGAAEFADWNKGRYAIDEATGKKTLYPGSKAPKKTVVTFTVRKGGSTNTESIEFEGEGHERKAKAWADKQRARTDAQVTIEDISQVAAQFAADEDMPRIVKNRPDVWPMWRSGDEARRKEIEAGLRMSRSKGIAQRAEAERVKKAKKVAARSGERYPGGFAADGDREWRLLDGRTGKVVSEGRSLVAPNEDEAYRRAFQRWPKLRGKVVVQEIPDGGFADEEGAEMADGNDITVDMGGFEGTEVTVRATSEKGQAWMDQKFGKGASSAKLPKSRAGDAIGAAKNAGLTVDGGRGEFAAVGSLDPSAQRLSGTGGGETRMVEFADGGPEDWLRQARSSGDPSHVFHRVMSQADRDAFDQWLVKNNDPLAMEAGTQESRFKRKASQGQHSADFADGGQGTAQRAAEEMMKWQQKAKAATTDEERREAEHMVEQWKIAAVHLAKRESQAPSQRLADEEDEDDSRFASDQDASVINGQPYCGPCGAKTGAKGRDLPMEERKGKICNRCGRHLYKKPGDDTPIPGPAASGPGYTN